MTSPPGSLNEHACNPRNSTAAAWQLTVRVSQLGGFLVLPLATDTVTWMMSGGGGGGGEGGTRGGDEGLKGDGLASAVTCMQHLDTHAVASIIKCRAQYRQSTCSVPLASGVYVPEPCKLKSSLAAATLADMHACACNPHERPALI